MKTLSFFLVATFTIVMAMPSSASAQPVPAKQDKVLSDLIPLGVKHVKAHFSPKEEMGTFQIGVKNIGKAPAPKGVTIHLALSVDQKFVQRPATLLPPDKQRDDILLTDTTLTTTAKLMPGKSELFTVNLDKIPNGLIQGIKKGKFYLVVIVDMKNAVKEQNEKNNIRFVELKLKSASTKPSKPGSNSPSKPKPKS